ncbi:MAG: SDR family oxidoreductase [Bacillota bacterium]
MISDKPEGPVLVTGATGLVGSDLAARLLGRGYRVRVLARKAEEVNLPGAEIAEGDITDPDSLEKACAGVEAAVHLVAVIREKEKATFQEINCRGTVNILRSAENAGVARFIHLSALGATENPAYRYAHSKWLAEEAVRSSMIRWTIIRPSVIYGRGFGFFNRIIQSMRISPPFLAPVPGMGGSLFQPIAVEDVSDCIIRALEDAGFMYGVYEIGGPEHVSYKEMVDAVLKILGQRRLKLPVPVLIMKLAVPVMGLIFKDPPVTPVELKQLELNNITDIDSVCSNFGFRPRRFQDGLAEIKDYLESI